MFYYDEYRMKTLSLTLDKENQNLLKGTFFRIDPTRSTFTTVLKCDSFSYKIEDLVSTGTPADKMDNFMDIDPYIVSSNAI